MKKAAFIILCMLVLLNTQAQKCPASITVMAPSGEGETGKTFQMSVTVNGLPENVSITYSWSISTGKIVSGQGTPVITVDPGNEPGYCTATVEIGGLPAECVNTSSASVDVLKGPEKISSTTVVTATALNKEVKNFISQTDLTNISISQTATIYIYSVSKQQFNNIKSSIEKAFATNNILSYQFSIKDGGLNKAAAVEMYINKSNY